MTNVTTLGEAQITQSIHETVTVELVQPDGEPARIRIVWPPHTTTTTPAKYAEAAAAAMKVLANASTELSRIKAGKRL